MAGVIQSGNWVAKGGAAKGPARGPARGAANNPLYQPGVTLAGKPLADAAMALANAQTSGPLAALAQQIASNNRGTQATMKLAGGYYNQLGNQAQQGVTNERGIASDLNSTLQGISNQTNSQLQGLGQSAQDSLMKYAPQGEGGLSTSAMGSLASEIARQKGLAAQQEGTSRMFGANQGANYSGLAAVGQGTQALAGTEGLTKIGQSGTVKNQPLMNQVASLNASKGALYSKAVGQLRQQEINNTITRAGLGLKSQSLAQTAAQNAARNQLTARGQNITLNGQQLQTMSRDKSFQLDKQRFGAAQAKDTYLRTHGLGPYRPPAAAKLPATTPTGQRVLTPVQQQRLFGEVDTARQLIPQMQAPLSKAAATSLQKVGLNVSEGQKLSEGQIRHLLAVGIHPGGSTRYDPGLVDAAYALAGWGYLTQKQIVGLNKLGLIVGNRYRRGSAPKGLGGVGVGGVASTLGGVGSAIGNVGR